MQKSKLALLLYCLLHLLANTIHAQEWRYEGTKENRNSIFGGSWLDEQGNSYHNVQLSRRTGKSTGTITGKHLLMLDKNGRFKGIIQVNGCQNRSTLLPFSKDRLLSLGYNCNTDTMETPDMRLFDKSGKLVATGPSYGLSQMSTVRTESGYTAFFKDGLHSTKPTVEMLQIDWDFNVKSTKLDLSSYLVDGKKLGMVPNLPAVQGADGKWLVDAFLGTPQKDGGLSTDWPFVYLTDGKKTLGRFPKKNSITGLIFGTQAYRDGYAVMMLERNGEAGDLVLYMLDHKAKHQKTIKLNLITSQFDRFLIHNDHILVFSNDYDPQQGRRYTLRLFDMDGNLKSDRVLHDDRIIASAVLPYGTSSIVVAGAIVPKKADTYSFVWKLDIEMPTEPTQAPPVTAAEPEPELPSPISDMTIDDVDETVLSVAVFPNPASIFIHFTLENTTTPNARFQLRVFSMNGRTVHQAVLDRPSYELRIAELPAGTYSYQLQNLDNKKEFITGKFIKT